ncbi:MAG: peptidase [Bacteroidota bacterium]|nr:peptidase [Bacteroidota bacterium]
MQLKYILSFPEPHTHYVQVIMQISNISAASLNLKMATWTPGSYLIREFQKNIDYVEATINGKTSRVEKTNKNTWKIDTENAENIIVQYAVYSFEYSVRTNFVDDSHALINGASTFLFLENFENIGSEIKIEPHPSWKNISTSLNSIDNNKWTRISQSTDELIDSPIEIGNHISHFFEVENIPHELAMYGKSNCDIEKLIADLKKVIAEEIKLFGSHPCDHYVFIIHHTDNNFGGLEHLYSSVNQVPRWSYDQKKYQQVISLLAHEYFHLWNVKRIRPMSLGPFDYENENYTTLLWFFEGITSYYDDYLCYRAGITSKNDYIDILEKNLNTVLNMPGIEVQTLAESSFDTWIKYYRKNENSNNSQISYYTKGAIIGIIFNFIILDATNGEKSLDDVMKTLYDRFLNQPERGITENNLLEISNAVSGIDFAPYFNKYIHAPGLPDIEIYFELAGIELKDINEQENIFLGMSTEWKDGKLFVTELDKNYGAFGGGINILDEIVFIDDFRTMKDFTKLYANKIPGDTVNMIVARQGAIKTLNITLTVDKRKHFNLIFPQNISERKTVILNRWL